MSSESTPIIVVYPTKSEELKFNIISEGGDNIRIPGAPFQITETPDVDLPQVKQQQPIPDINLDELRNQLQEIQAKIDRISSSQAAQKQMEEKIQEKIIKNPPKPIEKINYISNTPFIVLPQLDAIVHPLYQRSDKTVYVSVGGKEYLHAVDELRAAGWHYYGEYGIEEFLLQGAWVVWNRLRYSVIIRKGLENDISWIEELYNDNKQKQLGVNDAFDAFKKTLTSEMPRRYTNNIEKFNMRYPDAQKQDARLKNGYKNLIDSIRKDVGIVAFLPSNYDTKAPNEPYKCPPKNIKFYIGNTPVSNFFQNWTSIKTGEVRVVNVGGVSRLVPECAPQPGMEYNWIPEQYRESVQQLFDLVQFRYIQPSKYQDAIFTLLDTDENNQRQSDENGQFIYSTGSDRISYKLYLAKIKLNYELDPAREGFENNEPSMREYLEEQFSDIRYYPLIHLILNAPVPDGEGPKDKPGLYRKAGYIYEATIRYKAGGVINIRRMYPDAPLSAFRDGLIKYYLGKPNPGEQYEDCLERFIKNVYNTIKKYKVLDNLPVDVPTEYRKILSEILFYNGVQPTQCLISSSDLSEFGPTAGAVKPLKLNVPSVSALKKEGPTEIKSRIQELIVNLQNLGVN